jgi:hypothetical protein
LENNLLTEVKNQFKGINFINNLSVMTSEIYPIEYISRTYEYQFIRAGKNPFELTGKYNGLVGANQQVILNILNSDLGYFKKGRYTVLVDDISLNNKNYKKLSIEKYKSFHGVGSVIPAILVPGWGTKLVRGKKGNAWITISTYGLTAIGYYFWNESQKSYDGYLAATSQVQMDEFYNQYLDHRDKALLSMSGALSIYSINLTYVLFKGLKNNLSTAVNTHRYKIYSKNF